MIVKMESIGLILVVSVCLAIQPSTCGPLENDKLVTLSERFDKLQTKVESLEAENEELKFRMNSLQFKVAYLEEKDFEIEEKMKEQEEEIVQLKAKMDVKLLDFIHLSRPIDDELVPDLHTSNDKKSESSIYRKDSSFNDFTTRAAVPSSCRELSLIGHSLDGLYLVQNRDTKKVDTVLCIFGTLVSEDLIGHVDVKTKTVHFYVQKNSNFGPNNTVIPFELARLNEGNAFDLPSGIFTVPVNGIYHFDFSALKDSSASYLSINLQVNGANVGRADTNQGATGTYHTVSLSASFRLAAGDKVNLYNVNNGVLLDNGNHFTHFTGWLVEEQLL